MKAIALIIYGNENFLELKFVNSVCCFVISNLLFIRLAFKLCLFVCVQGIASIPPSAFFGPEHKHISGKLIRFCYCKVCVCMYVCVCVCVVVAVRCRC